MFYFIRRHLCPWCGHSLPGKPGQFCICINCQKDLCWCEDRAFRSEAEALAHRENQKAIALAKQQASEAIRRVQMAERQQRGDRRKQSAAKVVTGLTKLCCSCAEAPRKTGGLAQSAITWLAVMISWLAKLMLFGSAAAILWLALAPIRFWRWWWSLPMSTETEAEDISSLGELLVTTKVGIGCLAAAAGFPIVIIVIVLLL